MRYMIIVLSILLVLAFTTPGWAGEKNENKWHWELTPLYLWASSMEGDAVVLGTEAPVKVSFSDIIKNLDFGYMGHIEIKNNKWAIMADIVYADLGSEKAGFDVDVKQTFAEFAGGYRLHPVIEVIAGVRYFSLKTGIRSSIFGLVIESEGSNDGIDPFVGARFNYEFPGSKFSLGARGDIGGFGVGSKIAWNLNALVNWQISKLIRVFIGYRYFYMDTKDKNPDVFSLDITVHGPGLGLTFCW